MSKAFKCDRCGRFEEEEPVAQVKFTLPTLVAAASGSSSRRTIESDLCSQCLAGLTEWRDYHKKDTERG